MFTTTLFRPIAAALVVVALFISVHAFELESQFEFFGIPLSTSLNWNILDSLDGIRWSGRNGSFLPFGKMLIAE
jgi:hypothetical protein